MSFVSVVATEKQISLVSDGRVSVGDEAVQEDYQKFRVINDKTFLAFAGNLKPCEVLLDWYDTKDYSNHSLEDIAKEIWSIGRCIKKMGYRFMVSFGGFENNVSEIYATNFEGDKPIILKPKGTEVSFSFLHNSDFSDGELEGIYQGFLENSNVCTLNDLTEAQSMLVREVAKTDFTVNDTIFSEILSI